MSEFSELQERAVMALAYKAEPQARAAIKAMKDYVARAERDLEKLIAWKKAQEASNGRPD